MDRRAPGTVAAFRAGNFARSPDDSAVDRFKLKSITRQRYGSCFGGDKWRADRPAACNADANETLYF